jgi:hypothetical protein
MKLCAAILLLAATLPSVPEAQRNLEEELLSTTKPVVRVISPETAGFVIRGGSEQKLLVVIEVISASGSDIDVDDHGIPRFVEPNHNVDVFSSDVVSHREYVNRLGQTVLQVVSEMPVEQLRAGDMAMQPPINFRGLDKTQKQYGFSVPMRDMVKDVVEFNFRVKDRGGIESDPDSRRGRLMIGLATEVYQPPPIPLGPDGKPLAPEPDRSKKPPAPRSS